MNEQNGGLTVGVDLGGTKIAAGTVDPGGEVVSRVRVPTPHDPDRIAGAIAEAVQQVRKGWDDVRAVGVGAAGYVDADRSTVRFASCNGNWISDSGNDISTNRRTPVARNPWLW